MQKRKRQAKPTKRRALGRLYPGTKLSDYRFEKLIKAFAEDLSATETAARTRISVRAVNDWFVTFRELIYIEVWENLGSFGAAGLRLRSAASSDRMEEPNYPGDPFIRWFKTREARPYLEYLDMRTEMMERIGNEWDERRATRGIGGDDLAQHLHQMELFARWSSRSLDRPEFEEAVQELKHRYLALKSRSASEVYALAKEYKQAKERTLPMSPDATPFFWELRNLIRRHLRRRSR